MPSIAVIVNPAAGKGRGAVAGEIAAARLRALGAEVRVYMGASAAETRRLAAEALATQPAALVVVGGDGTLSTMLDELVQAEVPLAIVPAGTGNDLARELGLPFGSNDEVAAAAELALRGSLRGIDLGEAVCPDGHSRFLTVAALGFDSYVSERTNRLRWPKGAMRYYLALLIELARLRSLDFSLRVGHSEAQPLPGVLMAVGNTRSYGGGMPVCPLAVPSDGLLDVTHVQPIRRLQLLRFFPLLLQGKHLSRPEVRSFRAEKVEVSAPGLIVYADGERIGTESVTFAVLHAALQVFVPPVQHTADQR